MAKLDAGTIEHGESPRVLGDTLRSRVFRRAALLRRSAVLRGQADKHDDRARLLERSGEGRAANEHRAMADAQRSQAAEDVRSRDAI